jgi:hypothetical protein
VGGMIGTACPFMNHCAERKERFAIGFRFSGSFQTQIGSFIFPKAEAQNFHFMERELFAH